MRIVFVTGAGISISAGIPGFRTEGGIWTKPGMRELAEASSLVDRREEVIRFFEERFKEYINASPTLAHMLIASLEQSHDVTVITQNIDSLHEKAGSQNIIHIHGTSSWIEDEDGRRPDVVLFGEPVRHYTRSLERIYDSDILVYVGTSGEVYPVSHFVALAQRWRCRRIEINPEDTPVSRWFHESWRISADDGLEKLVEVIRYGF